jgi:hypothetical protein
VFSEKCTLIRALVEGLNLPVLHLDRVWHIVNDDKEAKSFFEQVQIDFMTRIIAI